jgi:hypothetical protein
MSPWYSNLLMTFCRPLPYNSKILGISYMQALIRLAVPLCVPTCPSRRPGL